MANAMNGRDEIFQPEMENGHREVSQPETKNDRAMRFVDEIAFSRRQATDWSANGACVCSPSSSVSEIANGDDDETIVSRHATKNRIAIDLANVVSPVG